MKRIVLMILSAAAGAVLLTLAAHRVNATGGSGDGSGCYYNLWTCSYADSNAYWDGCDPAGGEGWTSTTTAKALCTTYHPS